MYIHHYSLLNNNNEYGATILFQGVLVLFNMYICMYIYTYIYTYMYVCVCENKLYNRPNQACCLAVTQPTLELAGEEAKEKERE